MAPGGYGCAPGFSGQAESKLRELKSLVDPIRSRCGHLSGMDPCEDDVGVHGTFGQLHSFPTGVLGRSFIGPAARLHQGDCQLAQHLDLERVVIDTAARGLLAKMRDSVAEAGAADSTDDKCGTNHEVAVVQLFG